MVENFSKSVLSRSVHHVIKYVKPVDGPRFVSAGGVFTTGKRENGLKNF